METRQVELPVELLEKLCTPQLAEFPEAERVRIALAALLFQQGAVSTGRATELSGLGRVEFEFLLADMRIPAIRYDVEDFERDTELMNREQQKSQA